MTIVELGRFQTPGAVDPRAAYTHPSYAARPYSSLGGSDPVKAAQRIWDLSLQPEPPLHFPIGKDAIAMIRAEVKGITENVDKHEAASEGLGFD